jgi:hypothetical protein
VSGKYRTWKERAMRPTTKKALRRELALATKGRELFYDETVSLREQLRVMEKQRDALRAELKLFLSPATVQAAKQAQEQGKTALHHIDGDRHNNDPDNIAVVDIEEHRP